MKKAIAGAAILLAATVMDAQADSFRCKGGIISTRDSMGDIRKKCYVIDVERSDESTATWVTVEGAHGKRATFVLRRNKVVRIDKE
jgi:hypothetical protein